MTPTEVSSMTALIGALWPKCDWTPEMYAEFETRVRWKDAGRTEQAIRDHRVETRFNSPAISAILGKLASGAQHEPRQAPSPIARLRREMQIPADVAATEVLIEEQRRLLTRARACYGNRGDRLWWVSDGVRLKWALVDAGATVEQAEHLLAEFMRKNGVDLEARPMVAEGVGA